MKTTILLSTLFALFVNSRSLFVPRDIPRPTPTCSTTTGGNIPDLSDAAMAAFNLGLVCKDKEHLDLANFFDSTTRDPKRPNCKVMYTENTAQLALCIKDGYTDVDVKMIKMLACNEAAHRWIDIIWSCGSGTGVRGHTNFPWGSLNLYHAP